MVTSLHTHTLKQTPFLQTKELFIKVAERGRKIPEEQRKEEIANSYAAFQEFLKATASDLKITMSEDDHKRIVIVEKDYNGGDDF